MAQYMEHLLVRFFNPTEEGVITQATLEEIERNENLLKRCAINRRKFQVSKINASSWKPRGIRRMSKTLWRCISGVLRGDLRNHVKPRIFYQQINCKPKFNQKHVEEKPSIVEKKVPTNIHTRSYPLVFPPRGMIISTCSTSMSTKPDHVVEISTCVVAKSFSNTKPHADESACV